MKMKRVIWTVLILLAFLVIFAPIFLWDLEILYLNSSLVAANPHRSGIATTDLGRRSFMYKATGASWLEAKTIRGSDFILDLCLGDEIGVVTGDGRVYQYLPDENVMQYVQERFRPAASCAYLGNEMVVWGNGDIFFVHSKEKIEYDDTELDIIRITEGIDNVPWILDMSGSIYEIQDGEIKLKYALQIRSAHQLEIDHRRREAVIITWSDVYNLDLDTGNVSLIYHHPKKTEIVGTAFLDSENNWWVVLAKNIIKIVDGKVYTQLPGWNIFGWRIGDAKFDGYDLYITTKIGVFKRSIYLRNP